MKKQLTLALVCCVILAAIVVGYQAYSRPQAGTFAGNRWKSIVGIDVVAVGDIAYKSGKHELTAAITSKIDPDAVLVLGDTVYEEGTPEQYRTLYEPTWGKFLPITIAAPGNHEYKTPGASGYYGYFGEQAGPSNLGYFSVDKGTWHIVSLNSEIIDAAQLEWLEKDLEATDKKCILAFWHKPLFSSGAEHGNTITVKPFWDVLYKHGADLVLNGHEHLYERFAKQNSAGVADPKGIRQITVGTGGGTPHGFKFLKPNSEAHVTRQYGVLHLKLKDNSYNAEFVPAEGYAYTDEVDDVTCN